MRLNHIHVAVQDLGGALQWLDRVWQVKPESANDRMATCYFGNFVLILDAGDIDTQATIGFESEDCDRDFRAVVERGAMPIEPPGDKPWGARSAYLHGPGRLTFEIEQPLK
jgi:uncharacterized glyoxalase superfamily protein PhnB